METVADSSVSLKAVILLGVLLGLVVLLVWKTRRTGIYVGIGLAIVVVGGVLFLTFGRYQSAQRYEAHAQLEVIQPQEATRRDSFSSVSPFWHVTVENEFEADLYPSLATAAQALGKKVGLRLMEVTAEKKPVTEVLICSSEKFDDRLADNIREGIIRVNYISNIQVSSSRIPGEQWPHKVNPQAVTLNLEFDLYSDGGPSWPNIIQKHREGTLKLNAIGQGGEFREEVQFIDKPWVSDFSGFVNRQPQRNWLIAQSQRPCTSADEANRQAITDAANKLTQMVYPKVRQYSRGFLSRRSELTHQQVQNLIETELRTSYAKEHFYRQEIGAAYPGGYIRDRFVQRFGRDYGEVWREAALVDASGDKLERLAKKCAGIQRAERETWLKIVLSALGMLGIVCVVYVFLNSATKGYYRAALRVAAVVLAMVIIGIAMVLA